MVRLRPLMVESHHGHGRRSHAVHGPGHVGHERPEVHAPGIRESRLVLGLPRLVRGVSARRRRHVRRMRGRAVVVVAEPEQLLDGEGGALGGPAGPRGQHAQVWVTEGRPVLVGLAAAAVQEIHDGHHESAVGLVVAAAPAQVHAVLQSSRWALSKGVGWDWPCVKVCYLDGIVFLFVKDSGLT